VSVANSVWATSSSAQAEPWLTGLAEGAHERWEERLGRAVEGSQVHRSAWLVDEGVHGVACFGQSRFDFPRRDRQSPASVGENEVAPLAFGQRHGEAALQQP